MKNKSLLITIVILMIAKSSIAQITGTFTDPRDGQTYKTITIKIPLIGTSNTWMAQNLNYKVAHSWAYDNDESYRKNLGLLYTWDDAMKTCPVGWHLPSDADWSALVNSFGGEDSAGIALKSTKGWNKNGNGTNNSGFNALPGGYHNYDGTFGDVGNYGAWRSSVEDSSSNAWIRILGYDGISIGRGSMSKAVGLSVRCVRGN